MEFAHDFQTILGRNLVGELKNFVHRPFLLVTMEDLWPKFAAAFEGADCHRYFVRSVDEKALLADLAGLPPVEAVVGLGGGMARRHGEVLRLEEAAAAVPGADCAQHERLLGAALRRAHRRRRALHRLGRAARRSISTTT